MGFFSKFEGKMEDTFEGAAGKMQKSPISPVQIMKKAEKQMRREKVVSAGKQFAPTLYTVLVNPDDDQRLFGFYPTLAGECETRLAASANSEGLAMDGHPLVRFIVDDSLKHGKFDIIAEVVSAPIVAQLRAEEMQRYGMAGAGRANAGSAGNEPAYNAAGAMHAQPQAAASGSPQAAGPFGAQAPQPDYGQQVFGAPDYEAGAVIGSGHAGGAYPDIQEQPQAKPPLPYVPENEIDYSVDYGEYTFDSKNFEDYRDKTPQAADSAADAEEAPSAPHRPAHARQAADPYADVDPEGIYAPRGFEAQPLPNPAYPQGVAAYGAPAANLYAAGQQAGAYPAAAAYPAPAAHAAGAAPVYAGAPHTVAFAAGAAQANPVPNGAAVRARLIDANSNRSYDLATNRILIGRESGNDIVLNDLNVSRRHAQVAFEPQGVWVVTDLGSTNGTFVNGMPVSRRGLADGDRITLGVTEFVFSMR